MRINVKRKVAEMQKKLLKRGWKGSRMKVERF